MKSNPCAASLTFCRPEAFPIRQRSLVFVTMWKPTSSVKKIFDTINQHLADKGLRMREGTIVDTPIIAAPTSTKNAEGQHDPVRGISKGLTRTNDDI